MKTKRAIELAGNASRLAELLDITPGAISQWGEDVPKGRVWQLRALKPEWFQSQEDSAAPAPRAA